MSHASRRSPAADSSEAEAAAADLSSPAALNRDPAQAVRGLVEALSCGDAAALREKTKNLHDADYAAMIDFLTSDQRCALMDLVGSELPAGVLPDLDGRALGDIAARIDDDPFAELLSRLESDDALYVLEHVAASRRAAILNRISFLERFRIARNLDYPEHSAGRMMRSKAAAAPAHWTVGDAIDYLRRAEDLPDHFIEIFVVDPYSHPIGSVSLSVLLRSQRSVPLERIMARKQTIIPADMDSDDAAELFRRYHLLSAAVVDEDRRLIGVVTGDDIVEVIDEKAEEDMNHLGGVGEESLDDGVARIVAKRFSWLLVNMGAAIAASLMIAMFENALQRLTALAILMPIVVSMGANGGTQTLTVAVRALAMRELAPINALRIALRECMAGFIGGSIFAVILAATAFFWFGDAGVAAVIAAATLITMTVAAAAGVLTPLALKRSGVDPAVGSAVIVTTAGDLVGFASFLGLATLFLF